MNGSTLIAAVALGLAMLSGLAVLYYFVAARGQSNYRNLMGSAPAAGMGTPSELRQRLKDDPTGKEYERLKKASKRAVKGKEKLTIEELFFRAGYFASKQQKDFKRLRVIIPCVVTPLMALAFGYFGASYSFIGIIFGVLWGMQLPYSILQRQIKARDEDILYYLPLVIEQIAIGVSSSLDIGPCIQRVVSMADERDTHNVVTELLRHAQHHVRSGASLEDALNEVGKRSGQAELKHAFMALSQVAKHGGEITRQLQELADAVGSQRESKIEAKIKKLELEATFPVTLVFAGFIVILLVGFFIQIQSAL